MALPFVIFFAGLVLLAPISSWSYFALYRRARTLSYSGQGAALGYVPPTYFESQQSRAFWWNPVDGRLVMSGRHRVVGDAKLTRLVWLCRFLTAATFGWMAAFYATIGSTVIVRIPGL